MIPLDLPPQIEMQIVEIAKVQNISVDDYILSVLQEKLAQKPDEQDIDDDEFYRLAGFKPLTTGKHTITNEHVNELREQYGI